MQIRVLVLDVGKVTSLKAQMEVMQKQMVWMQVNAVQAPILVCELCAGGYAMQDCQVGNTFGQQKHVNYMNNYQHDQGNSYGNPYSHAYNPNWKMTHPNFSWGPQQQEATTSAAAAKVQPATEKGSRGVACTLHRWK